MRSSRVFDAKDKKRLVVVACFLFFLFCLIVVQFFYLQITQGNKWEKIASNQHQLEITQFFLRMILKDLIHLDLCWDRSCILFKIKKIRLPFKLSRREVWSFISMIILK